ncbi:MAG: nuclear transport factor 2 family protein [Candidatus Binatia bacterium]
MSMTLEQRVQILEDIQAITALKAAYCNGADGGWDRPSHDADAVAALFVADGMWDGGKIGRGEGREGIRALFTSFKRFPFAFHRITNPIIKVNGDTATGEWHFLVPITLDRDRARWFGGIYSDEFVRTPDGWKFKSLKATSAFVAKNEQGWIVG